MECSYCKAGLNERRPLGSPRPQGQLAQKIEAGNEVTVIDQKSEACPEEVQFCSNTETELSWGFNDIVNTDFSSDFNLTKELWQYE